MSREEEEDLCIEHVVRELIFFGLRVGKGWTRLS